MSAPQFFVAHGEKLALVVVAGGCAAALAITFTDADMRPKGASAEAIQQMNDRIADAFIKHEPPVFIPPRDVPSALRTRFGAELPTARLLSWLTALPDAGPPIPKHFQPYVFIVHPPQVAVEDRIGSLELSLAAQPPSFTGGGRIADGAEASWTRRNLDDREVLNHAGLVGLVVEVRLGDGKWRPLEIKGAGPGGVVPLSLLKDGKLGVPSLADWEKHSFRARWVVKATGLDPEQLKADIPENTVLVHPGPVEMPENNEVMFFRDLAAKLTSKDAGMIGRTLKGYAAAQRDLKVPGVVPAAGERLFMGPECEEATVRATAWLRFVLSRVSMESPEAGKPPVEVATFQIKRQHKQGDQLAWCEKPSVFKVRVGDRVGDKVKKPTPFSGGQLRNVDLTTDFEVDRIERGKERVHFYQVRTKSRAQPGKDKEFEIRTYKRATDVVWLRHIKTGEVLPFTKVDKIRPPAGDGVVIYPKYAGDYDEEAEFDKTPSDFRQEPMTPPEPVLHKAGTGPLAKLREDQEDKDFFTTDVDYVELPDGRLVWWDPLNHQANHWPKEDAAKPAEPAPAEPAGPTRVPIGTPRPGAGVPPGGMPPGMPPGAMPPGALPPGMPPPGAVPPGTGQPPKRK